MKRKCYFCLLTRQVAQREKGTELFMDIQGLTPNSANAWFETDEKGVLLSQHWKHPPLPLQTGQSIAPLFAEAPHQLTNLFDQLSTREQVTFALPCRGLLLLLHCKKADGKLRWEVDCSIHADPYTGRSEETAQIRECLTAMDNCLSYLLENSLESSFERDMANNALNRCQLLMKHCLNMERYHQLIHGEYHPKLQRINLRSFFNSLSRELEQDPRCSQVKPLVPRDNIIIQSDPSALLEIILNILTNSLAFSPSDAPVSIRLEKQENFAVFRISDEGDGLPAGDVTQALTPYFSLRPDNGQRAGLGLGLTNAYLLCQALGGSILISSKENYGTTVLLRFPMDQREEDGSEKIGSRDSYSELFRRGHFSPIQVFLSALGSSREEN